MTSAHDVAFNVGRVLGHVFIVALIVALFIIANRRDRRGAHSTTLYIAGVVLVLLFIASLSR